MKSGKGWDKSEAFQIDIVAVGENKVRLEDVCNLRYSISCLNHAQVCSKQQVITQSLTQVLRHSFTIGGVTAILDT